MSTKTKKKFWSKKHPWYIAAILALGALIGILPIIGGVLGWTAFVIALVPAVALGAIVWKSEIKMSQHGKQELRGTAVDDTQKCTMG